MKKKKALKYFEIMHNETICKNCLNKWNMKSGYINFVMFKNIVKGLIPCKVPESSPAVANNYLICLIA